MTLRDEQYRPQEHPDDRAHRRRKNRNQPPAGKTGAGQPFSRWKATKFTEVGYVGRDVETDYPRPGSIVRIVMNPDHCARPVKEAT